MIGGNSSIGIIGRITGWAVVMYVTEEVWLAPIYTGRLSGKHRGRKRARHMKSRIQRATAAPTAISESREKPVTNPAGRSHTKIRVHVIPEHSDIT